MNPVRPDRDTLMAYVDGQLTPARRDEVERWAAQDAAFAAEIAALQAQNQALRDALDPLLDEPIPASLLHAARPTRPWARVASMALWLSASALAGSLATRAVMLGQESLVAQVQGEGTMNFVRQAELAYAVYTPDVRRPVEVRNGSDLTTWLSRRLHRPIAAPDALPGGLVLMGGRLLPGMPGKPAAQLMYQDAQGKRITVFLRAMAKPTAQTAFRIVDNHGTTTFYWVDQNWGYALTGELPRVEMLAAARALYQRYAPDAAPAPAQEDAPAQETRPMS